MRDRDKTRWVVASVVTFLCPWAIAQTTPPVQRPLPATKPRVVHVVVALADPHHQRIGPVPASLGNGDDPRNNLYWGAELGLRGFFGKSPEWQRVAACRPVQIPVLERCIYRHQHEDVYLIADAYRGRDIQTAIADFYAFAAGRQRLDLNSPETPGLAAGGAADLVAYIGHDGLMDFALQRYQYWADDKRRQVIILSCASKGYFADALHWTGARPLLWTTNLMAPEAYTLEAALAGWVRKESDDQIRNRAAAAYDKYQHCGPKAARNLLVTGW